MSIKTYIRGNHQLPGIDEAPSRLKHRDTSFYRGGRGCLVPLGEGGIKGDCIFAVKLPCCKLKSSARLCRTPPFKKGGRDS